MYEMKNTKIILKFDTIHQNTLKNIFKNLF